MLQETWRCSSSEDAYGVETPTFFTRQGALMGMLVND